ncbi:MAG: hypothetical protein L6422_03025 [Candidatus Marinimicrobia bacterium]|nr:hypothetical protein [Candidatus Neomarinimicrobiota bacterium]
MCFVVGNPFSLCYAAAEMGFGVIESSVMNLLMTVLYSSAMPVCPARRQAGARQE